MKFVGSESIDGLSEIPLGQLILFSIKIRKEIKNPSIHFGSEERFLTRIEFINIFPEVFIDITFI